MVLKKKKKKEAQIHLCCTKAIIPTNLFDATVTLEVVKATKNVSI